MKAVFSSLFPFSPGGTALHLAAEAGNVDIMEELLKAGADPEIRDEKGEGVTWLIYTASLM